MFLDLDLVPFIKDQTQLNALNQEVCENDWKNPGLQSAVQFAWAVSLRTVAQHHLTQEGKSA